MIELSNILTVFGLYLMIVCIQDILLTNCNDLAGEIGIGKLVDELSVFGMAVVVGEVLDFWVGLF